MSCSPWLKDPTLPFPRSDPVMTTATLVDAVGTRIVRPDGPARRRGRGRLRLAALVLGAAGLGVAIRGPALNPAPKASAGPRAVPIGVSALGRLAPEGEVIALAPGSG